MLAEQKFISKILSEEISDHPEVGEKLMAANRKRVNEGSSKPRGKEEIGHDIQQWIKEHRQDVYNKEKDPIASDKLRKKFFQILKQYLEEFKGILENDMEINSVKKYIANCNQWIGHSKVKTGIKPEFKTEFADWCKWVFKKIGEFSK